MSRIHDMGGRYGDGPVPETEDAEVFHSDWEARAMATTVLSAALGAWSIDVSRHARETLRPQDYARFTYYEKWMAALGDLLVARGLATPDDLANAAAKAKAQAPATPGALHDKAIRAADIPASQAKVVPYTRADGAEPQFAVGDIVRTLGRSPNVAVAGGHTRLPTYARDKVGTIVIQHGTHVLPDTNAHDKGEAPEPLYAVAFTAAELWGAHAEAGSDGMVLDLWQSYLIPAKP